MTATRPPSAMPSSWRLAGRLAMYRPRDWWTQIVLWTVVFAAPIATGLLLQAGFDHLDDGGGGVFLVAGAILAAEAARLLTFHVAAVLWWRWWVTTESVLRGNLLASQVANGGPDAGPAVADPGDALARFRDDPWDVAHFLDTWLDSVGFGVFTVLAFAVMATVDLRVTLVLALPLAVLLVLNRAVTPRLRARRDADRTATGQVTGFLTSMFDGVVTLKTTGSEGAALARLRQLTSTRRRTALADRLLVETLFAVDRASVELSIGLLLLLVAPAMGRGEFSVGDLALFTAYVSQLAGFPVEVGRLLARSRQTDVAFRRMATLLPADRPERSVHPLALRLDGVRSRAVARPQPERTPLRVLEVTGLTCLHPGGRGVLGVDLRVEGGSFTAITGVVGAGKTTLLRALLGLVPATGTVRWNGELVEDRAARFVPPHTAYLPQVPRLLSEALADNVRLGLDADDDALWAALSLAGLADEVAAMPEGLATPLGARGVRLSGGQAQRLATARALVRQPELLVLDDLSSALDGPTETALWSRLLDRPGTTVLAVSHRPAVLERADAVLVLDGGRLVTG